MYLQIHFQKQNRIEDKLVFDIDGDESGAVKAITRFGAEAELAAKGVVKKLGGVDLKALAVAGAVGGIGAALNESLETFVDFEDGFTDVVTLLDEKTAAENIDQLQEGVLALGAKTGQT